MSLTPRDVIAEGLRAVDSCNAGISADVAMSFLASAGFTIVPTALVEDTLAEYESMRDCALAFLRDRSVGNFDERCTAHDRLAAHLRACLNPPTEPTP